MRNPFLREQRGVRRIRYVWDYYRLWILGACALLLFVFYVTVSVRKNSRDTYLYVIFANTMADLGSGSPFQKGFEEFAEDEAGDKAVLFDTGNFFSLRDGRITGNYYYEKAVVLLDGKKADAVVMNTDDLRILGARGRLMDLRDERTSALLEKYGGRVITAAAETGDLTGQEIPVGIDLSDSRLVTEEKAWSEGCALGVSALVQHPEAVETFLAYVLPEQERE